MAKSKHLRITALLEWLKDHNLPKPKPQPTNEKN